jgi:hypothetical protein
MIFGRRAQASVEYVVSYSWAILVILVIGVALWRMGILSPRESSMSFTGFGKLKPQLSGTGLKPTGEFEGIFTNGAGGKIFVKGVAFSNADTGEIICCSHPNFSPACASVPAENVDVGGKTTAELTAGNLPKIAAGDVFKVHLEECILPLAQTGQPYSIKIEINYDALNGNQKVPHQDAGTIRGSFE